MPDERKAIHAYLTPAVHDAWQEFADGEGISMSGLLEALGEAIAGDHDHPARTVFGGADCVILSPVVKRARQVDAQRRRRGGS